jgi:putative tryptophan/tyrosine transport system substrate-binding protein
MKRRQFSQLLAGMSLSPFAAHAQGAREAVKVGFVYPGIHQLVASRIDAISTGIRAAGYPLAQIEMVVRVTDGDPAKIAPMVAEVLAAKIAVFISTGPSTLRAALAITRTLPIVATNFEEDPEASGYVQGLARPGRNITGVFLDFPNFAGKWIELLRECLPRLSRLALMWDPTTGRIQVDALAKATAGLNIQTDLLEVKERGDYAGAFAVAKDRGADAAIMLSSPLVPASAKELSELSLHYRLPAITMFAEFPRTGGLFSYGPNLQAANRQIGMFVGKILAGSAPGALPIERPVKFELIINARTAEALGIAIPAVVQARADEMIE